MRQMPLIFAIAVCAASPVLGAEPVAKDPISGCGIVLEDAAAEGDVFTWIGPCKDGLADGSGVVVWISAGQLVAKYEGGMMAGKMHGAGTLTFREGDGFSYIVGEFAEGDVVGEGFYKDAAGNSYEGTFANGTFDGSGVYTQPDGSFYDGAFSEGIPHGLGLSVAVNGEEYAGNFEEGERHGDGFLKFPDGGFYSGEFDRGIADGQGIYYDPDGSVYAGSFVNGDATGIGTYTDAEGVVLQGRFQDNLPVGEVLVHRPDGTSELQTWENGEPVQ